MQKKVKARKTHSCDRCDKDINVGSFYMREKCRVPIYEENEGEQTGIKYLLYNDCLNCFEEAEKENEEYKAMQETYEYKYIESMQEHKYP